MHGLINSIYTGSAVDGPGIRTVVFFQGCPLRCAYCHNPETHGKTGGKSIAAKDLFTKIERYSAYYGSKGGVTFSGGEALLQGEFLCEILSLCKNAGIHTAVDTSGAVIDTFTDRILELCDLIILDIKMNTEEEYGKYIKGSMKEPLDFLEKCNAKGVPVWIRRVIVPGINDTEKSVLTLKNMLSRFSCIEKTELLPFEKLCSEKYEKLGLEFPMKNVPAMDRNRLEILANCLKNET